MTDSSGNLSVDFLVGFTIFMLAFIWVATLIPNLFLGVSSHGIDFDAVAYRTGVILAEDPGAINLSLNVQDTTLWEKLPDSANYSIDRFGLAVSKETPNVLSEIKVNRFFNTTAFPVSDDYRKKAIFGDYPYHFNISLEAVGESKTKYFGDVRPDNYGFIRRDVKIKHFSNATINKAIVSKYKLNNTQNATSHEFSIQINTTKLLHGNITNPLINPNFHPAYQINPKTDNITILIDNLDQIVTPPYPAVQPGELNLTKVTLWEYEYVEDPTGGGGYMTPLVTSNFDNFVYPELSYLTHTPKKPPVNLTRCVTLAFEPGFFSGQSDYGSIYINLTFGITPTATYPGGKPFLNTTRRRPFDYNYNATDVTQPVLTDAVMEVAVW